MRKVLSLSLGALAVLLLTVALLGCGGSKSAPTGTNLKSMPAGSDQNVDDVLAELEALEPPEGVDPVLFDQLKEELARQLGPGGGKIVSTPSQFAINDFLEVDPVTDPPTVTWSCDNFIADGDLSGAVGIGDITPIAMYYGQYWTPEDGGENLLAKLADYDRDGTVAIADITPLAMTYGEDTAGYIVEWALDDGLGAPVETWTQGGDVAYGDHLAVPNANGFWIYEFQFAVDQLPDEEGVWARVVPYDGDPEPNLGIPSDPAIWIEVGGEPPIDFFVTDMLIQATGTVNTEAGSDYIDTDFYVSPLAGGDTFGEAPANQAVVMVLSDIAFLYEGNPYEFGSRDDLPIGDLTVEIFDGIVENLHGYMTYSVESIEVPADPEAWAEDATQPDYGYSGVLGPNDPAGDPGSVRLTAYMADSDYTQGSADLTVTVDLDLLEDVNAPEITDITPIEQHSNETVVHNVRLDWGDDEVGDEVPLKVALYDTADWSETFVFTAAAEPETPDPPETEGEYTFSRVLEFTFIQAKIAGIRLAQDHNYAWRVSEDDAGFERRSSLKKPDDKLTVIGPKYFDMNTWPEAEFAANDSRAPYMYFVPEDPRIRRNPCGHPVPPDPPSFEPDDVDAFADIVKGDMDEEGDEFLVVYGTPGPPSLPDAPLVYYLYGTSPPMTIAAADGEVPLYYRQPHLLAGLIAVVVETGDVSFGLFSQDGTYLGGVTRTAVGFPITRSDVFIDGTCDFGVRPWGSGLETIADFSDKIADQGDMDVVVFTFYNLWLRHDDSTTLPDVERGTHLILTVDGGGPLPDIVLRPHILDPENQGGLAYGALDISAEDIWFQNITQQIPAGNTYNVTLYNPGAGAGVTYPDNLVITP